MKLTIKHITLIIIALAFFSCQDNGGFTQTELGFSFKRCTKHDSAPKAKQGDIIFGQMKVLLNNKTEISSNYGSPDRLFVIGDATVGSINEFLMTLHLGDSAVMIAPADSVLNYTGNIECRPNDKIYIYLTVTQIISSAELTGLEKEVQEKQQREEEALTEYVLENYERAEKKESGLFFLEIKEGHGKKAEYGKRIFVNYAVTDTSGKLYDTNIGEVAEKHGVKRPDKLYKPFDFVLGDDALIAGWSEGLSYMKEGGRSTLIVPSKLAYGEVGFGKIPPYTPLVFDITLIKVENEQ